MSFNPPSDNSSVLYSVTVLQAMTLLSSPPLRTVLPWSRTARALILPSWTFSASILFPWSRFHTWRVPRPPPTTVVSPSHTRAVISSPKSFLDKKQLNTSWFLKLGFKSFYGLTAINSYTEAVRPTEIKITERFFWNNYKTNHHFVNLFNIALWIMVSPWILTSFKNRGSISKNVPSYNYGTKLIRKIGNPSGNFSKFLKLKYFQKIK